MRLVARSIRFSLAHWAALDAAASADRRLTGNPTTVSDILRRGAKRVCGELGVAWPE